MSQVNGYPEPLKDSLRDALQKALQDSGVEVPRVGAGHGHE